MSELFKVEKNIPLPGRVEKERMYKWSSMEIGDSVFFPDKTPKQKAARAAQRNASKYAAEHEGVKFTARTIQENGADIGVRIWRIA